MYNVLFDEGLFSREEFNRLAYSNKIERTYSMYIGEVSESRDQLGKEEYYIQIKDKERFLIVNQNENSTLRKKICGRL